MMEGVGISHGVQQSASALERYYSSGAVSLLQGSDVESSTTTTLVMQEGGEGEEMKNGVMASLRSPIAGDLASPQHYIPSSSSAPYSLISLTQASVAIKVREGQEGGPGGRVREGRRSYGGGPP